MSIQTLSSHCLHIWFIGGRRRHKHYHFNFYTPCHLNSHPTYHSNFYTSSHFISILFISCFVFYVNQHKQNSHKSREPSVSLSQPPTNRRTSSQTPRGGASVACIDQTGLSAMENGAGGGFDGTIDSTTRSSFSSENGSARLDPIASKSGNTTLLPFPYALLSHPRNYQSS